MVSFVHSPHSTRTNLTYYSIVTYNFPNHPILQLNCTILNDDSLTMNVLLPISLLIHILAIHIIHVRSNDSNDSNDSESNSYTKISLRSALCNIKAMSLYTGKAAFTEDITP